MKWSLCIGWAVVWLALPLGCLGAAAESGGAKSVDVVNDLDWMVGDWVLVPEDEALAAQGGTMQMTAHWDEGRAFLIREAVLTPPADSDEPVVTLEQRIGWDPVVNRIRSWSFSTDGSRGEATWFRDRDSWIVRGSVVLPDGSQSSYVNIYTYDGKDRCTWRIVRPPLADDDAGPARATWVRKTESNAP